MAFAALSPTTDEVLPAGMEMHDLHPHQDARGNFTEIFRQSWTNGIAPVQWNAISSSVNVLRGLHVHVRHTDYLTVLTGGMRLCLRDLRPESPTHGLRRMLDIGVDQPVGIVIPPGVAHGFYFMQSTLILVAVSHYWSHADELACRWDDPETGLVWGALDPVVSTRDAQAGSFLQFEMDYLQRRQSCQIYELAVAP